MDEGVDKRYTDICRNGGVSLRWGSVRHRVQGQRVSGMMVRLERKDIS